MKRLLLATLFGLVFGFVCFAMASSGEEKLPLILAISIIFGRTLIGFAIGISRFKMGHWSIHGIVMGALFGLPSALGAMMGNHPDFSPEMMFASTFVMGVIYGFLIELLTSVVFKARM
jgi:hypothetical protein